MNNRTNCLNEKVDSSVGIHLYSEEGYNEKGYNEKGYNEKGYNEKGNLFRDSPL